MKNLKMRTIIIPSKIDRLRLLVARLLNAIHHRMGARVFREISNKLALGIRVKDNDIYYVLTCVSDLLEYSS
jgi:hypothetical protein